MKYFNLLPLLFILSINMGCGPVKTETEEPSVETEAPSFIALSDIHFDPFFDTSLYSALSSSETSLWDSIFATTKLSPTYLDPKNDDDTNHFLFKSTLQDLKSRSFNPPFLILTGDLLLHNMQTKFSGSVTPEERLEFTIKTMDYVYEQLEALYPETPIYAAIGNNDNYVGNYSILPDGDFLKGIAPTWYRSLKSSVDSASFFSGFLRRGNYTARVPGNIKHKILSMNTILFYEKYPRTKIAADSVYENAITEQFQWLESELDQAEKNEEKVWLIYHIPPGVDVYKTVDTNSVVPNWTDNANQRFIDLVAKYYPVITAQFGGHTHKDSYAFMENDTGPVSFIHTTPSISMSNRNNPVYHHVQLDSGTRLKDFDAYYLKNAQDYSAAAWEKEYSFNEAFKNTSYSPGGLATLWNLMKNDTTLQNKYIQYFNGSYYKGSSSPNISKESWKAYWCAMHYQDFDGFEGCWK